MDTISVGMHLLLRLLVPVEPFRLIEPETVGIFRSGGAKLRKLRTADPGIEVVGDGMNRLAHAASSMLSMSMTKR